MATQALNNLQHNPYSPTQLIFGAAISAGSGAAAAAIFTPIAPIGGAIFGASSFLSSRIIDWIADTVGCCPENPIVRISKCVLSTLGGIAAGALITTAVGFPMTFATGAVLTVASCAVALAVILTLGGCLCSSAIATGAALALGGDDHAPSMRV